ncbi:PREDICTED: TBC1 domain family member 15-like [Nicrophorus vespilloides]|uniref:TBC1 domain family member 15-like n=1 Tax=Nicrophorus vespilloides TaxID=110193 RepID=A0ABM1N5T3_NICVS|nr:PREDICTED: TBC1 domain family member 15-like [Nicrophorus vespilloides]
MVKAAKMHEISDNCLTMYSLNDVVLYIANSYYSDYLDSVGTVYLTEYIETRERFFEWKPKEVKVLIDDDWNVVNNVAGCSDEQPKYIKIKLETIYGYWTSIEMNKFKVMDNKNDVHCALTIKEGTFEILYDAMNALFINQKYKNPLHHHAVLNPFEESSDIYRAFLDLEMFLDKETASNLWHFISAFQDLPNQLIEASLEKLGFSCKIDDTKRIDSTAVSKVEGTPIQMPNFPPLIIKSMPFTYYEFTNDNMNFDAFKRRVLEGGINPECRPKMWKYLLEYYPWKISHSELKQIDDNCIARYEYTKDKWVKLAEQDYRSREDLKIRISAMLREIELKKHIWSQVPSMTYTKISRMLKTLVIHSNEVGYLYGMTDLLLPFVRATGSESDCFWLLTLLLDRYHNSELKKNDIPNQLNDIYKILKILDPQYAKYFKSKNCKHMYFCIRWLWLLFTREFVENEIQTLWEVLFLDLPCPNFHLLVAIAILQTQKEYIMENDLDYLEIMKRVNTLKGTLRVNAIIDDAQTLHAQLEEILKIPDNIRTIKGMNLSHLDDLDDSTDSVIRDLVANLRAACNE